VGGDSLSGPKLTRSLSLPKTRSALRRKDLRAPRFRAQPATVTPHTIRTEEPRWASRAVSYSLYALCFATALPSPPRTWHYVGNSRSPLHIFRVGPQFRAITECTLLKRLKELSKTCKFEKPEQYKLHSFRRFASLCANHGVAYRKALARKFLNSKNLRSASRMERRGWDSNPWNLAVHRFSRPAPSAARAPLPRHGVMERSPCLRHGAKRLARALLVRLDDRLIDGTSERGSWMSITAHLPGMKHPSPQRSGACTRSSNHTGASWSPTFFDSAMPVGGASVKTCNSARRCSFATSKSARSARSHVLPAVESFREGQLCRHLSFLQVTVGLQWRHATEDVLANGTQTAPLDVSNQRARAPRVQIAPTGPALAIGLPVRASCAASAATRARRHSCATPPAAGE
jgi:hypothetical protein